ncbi:MAG: TIGR04255 family protein [Pseudomonadota bacterium]|nr:TIGR04255 family protein [Pseudomonadota bacterium]
MPALRPDYLPKYSQPPLVEVVLGVQFEKIRDWSSLDAGGVRETFSSEFQGYEEHPPLEPRFETFGGLRPAPPKLQLKLAPPVIKPRLWLTSADGTHLLQIQHDRFVLNWRRTSDAMYPHFEGILPYFERYLASFEKYTSERFGQKLAMTQCDLTYVNIIETNSLSEGSKYLKLIPNMIDELESLKSTYSTVIENAEGEKHARLRTEVTSVFFEDGEKSGFQLDLSVMGAPEDEKTEAAIKFLCEAREKIVIEFEKLTTPFAEESWGKVK